MNQPYILVRNHECDDLVYAVSTACKNWHSELNITRKQSYDPVLVIPIFKASMVVDARLVTRSFY